VQVNAEEFTKHWQRWKRKKCCQHRRQSCHTYQLSVVFLGTRSEQGHGHE
jgi:hypothetical protein